MLSREANDLDRVADVALDVFAKPREHVQFGPRWDAVVTATRAEDTVFAHLRLPASVGEDVTAWLAHPALVDVATACGVALADRADAVLFVPSHYDSVICHGPLSAAVDVTARRRPSDSDDVLVVDLTIAEPAGGVLLEIEGLTLRAVADLGGFTTLPPPATGAPPAHVARLLELAEALGIRPHEGVDVLTRVMASGVPRLLVSSVDLDDLREMDQLDVAPTSATAGLATPRGTGTNLVERLTEMWTDVLGVSPTPEDDFFELGGHSLIAIRLMSRVHKQLGVRLQLATLFEAPTIAKLADVLVESDPELARLGQPATDAEAATAAEPAASPARAGIAKRTLPESLVLMRDGSSDETPLFLVHGAGGNVLNLWGLAKALPAGRQIYGLQAHGIDGSVPPDNSVEEMAQRYVDAIRAVRARGPYLLGGYSGGGIVALEMSRLFAKSGDRVPRVVLLDTLPSLGDVPFRRALWHAAANAVRSGPASVLPWVRLNWSQRVLRRGHETLDDLDALNLGLGRVEQFGFSNLWEHFTAVANRYEMAQYDVDIVIAKAQKVFPAWPWHYHWRANVTGSIDTFIVPGDHFEMFTPENAPVLAGLIAPYLVDANAQAGDPNR
jgi:thioesterase domain-containing protein/acyl carrier protein